MATQKTPEQLEEQMSSVLGTFGSLMGVTTKSLKAQKLEYDGQIKQLARLHQIREDEAKVLLDSIKAEEKKIARDQKIAKSVVDATSATLQGLKQFAEGAISSNQAMYNSKEAFTAVIPTIDLVANTMKAAMSVISSAAQAIPVLGPVLHGSELALAAVVDVTTSVMKIALENSQKYVNIYKDLSKVGVTFGGSMSEMRAAAAESGMSLDSFQEYVSKSAENLHHLGGGMSVAARNIGILSKAALVGHDELLNLYGGFSGVAEGIAGYADIMRGYGIDLIKDREKLKASAGEYLTRMKELSELTGLSADKLKQEEQERQKNVLYQRKLAELESNANTKMQAQMIRENMTMTTQFFGKDVADVFQQAFQKGGIQNIQNPATLEFMSLMPEVAEAAQQFVEISKIQDPRVAEQRSAAMFKNLEERLKQNNDFTHLAGYQGLPPVLDKINSTLATAGTNFSTIVNLEKAREELREKEAQAKTDQVSVLTAALTKTLEANKMRLDARTEMQLPGAAKLADQMYQIQEALMKKFLPQFDTAVDRFTKVIDLILKNAEESPPPPPPITSAQVNEERQAAGQPALTRQQAEDEVAKQTLQRTIDAARKAQEERKAQSATANTPSTSTGALEHLKFTGRTGDEAHFDQLNAEAKEKFLQMVKEYTDAHKDAVVTIKSAARSNAEQAWLQGNRSQTNGRPVAALGTSNHEFNRAIDIKQSDIDAIGPELLKKYGFKPLPGDPGHLDYVGPRDEKPRTRGFSSGEKVGMAENDTQVALLTEIKNLMNAQKNILADHLSFVQETG